MELTTKQQYPRCIIGIGLTAHLFDKLAGGYSTLCGRWIDGEPELMDEDEEAPPCKLCQKGALPRTQVQIRNLRQSKGIRRAAWLEHHGKAEQTQ